MQPRSPTRGVEDDAERGVEDDAEASPTAS